MKKPEDKLQELVNRLQSAWGKNLVSVVLYGSAARDDFHEQYSDVNVLVVADELGAASLETITPVIRWWSHDEKLRPPQVLTHDELRDSADVFAIELLDIQLSHRTLHGEDVVSSIEVPMNLHRVEVEHELRVTLLRLRQHLLLSPDNQEELRVVLAKSVTSVLTLFRHSLIAVGEKAPHARPELLERVTAVFGVDTKPVQAVLELRHGTREKEPVRELYHGYMQAIAAVTRAIDRFVPKQKVQQVE